MVAFLQWVRQTLTGIILFTRRHIGEYQFLIQHVVGIPHISLAELVPCADESGFRVSDMQDSWMFTEELFVVFCVFIEFIIDSIQNVLLVRRPHSSIFQPDCIKVPAANHEIRRLTNPELRVDFNTLLAASGRNPEEVKHRDPYSPLF